jgi:hypothetical protein
MLAKIEQSRQQSMERYERDGLPPFMRPGLKPLAEEEAPVPSALQPA